MTDCILIADGAARQIWPNVTKAALCFKIHDGEAEPRPIFPPAMIDQIVEVEPGTVAVGAGFDGETFTNPPAPAPARRLIRKSLIIDRLQAAGKLTAARAALDAQDLYTQERWNVRAAIYADDETALALLSAIGADAAAILAAE